MTVSLKHLAVSGRAATANPNDIDGPNWNEEHVLTLTAGTLLGAHTDGAGIGEEVTLGDGISMSTSGVISTSSKEITPEDFGAVGDGSTVDTTAVASALTAASTSGKVVRLKATSKYRTGSITLPANVLVVGALAGLDITTDNVDADYTSLGGALLLDTGSTITLGAGAALRSTLIRPYGQTYPQSSSSAWVDTAITIAGYGAVVENNWIVGFATGITATNYSRLRIYDNAVDCNNGIYIVGSFDTSLIAHNHCWPYATHKHYADPALGGGANLPVSAILRTGIGLHLDTGNDDSRVNDNLFFGYLIGIQIDAGSLSLGENWVDHPTAQARAGNYGIKFGEGATRVTCTNLFVWGTNVGVWFDQLSTEDVSVLNFSINTIDTDAILVDSGTVHILHLDCDGIGGNAIEFTSNSTRFRVSHGDLINVTGVLYNLAANMTGEHFEIGHIYTDDTAGTAPTETNVQATVAVASASPLNLPTHGDFFQITGTTGFSSIAGSYTGRRVTLWFASALTISTGGNLKIAGAYTTTTHDTLDLIWDGFEWLELSRSVNS